MQEGADALEAAVLAQKGIASQGYCKGSSLLGLRALPTWNPRTRADCASSPWYYFQWQMSKQGQEQGMWRELGSGE